jgi:hypothetical protein
MRAAAFLLALAVVPALQPTLLDGTYLPVTDGANAICPQEVRTQYRDGELESLRVAYVGDCFYQGPFTYPCDERGVCGSDAESIEILNERRYRWTNLPYDVQAEFRLSESPVL